jgi:hypothetical protein
MDDIDVEASGSQPTKCSISAIRLTRRPRFIQHPAAQFTEARNAVPDYLGRRYDLLFDLDVNVDDASDFADHSPLCSA